MTARPSKSQRKRDRQALHELGRELVGLADKHLDELDLPERVANAIRDARGLARAALQRQLRYISACLETVDAEEVRAHVQKLLQPSRDEVARFHDIERWRDALLRDGEAAMAALLAERPLANEQHIRHLLRNATHELTAGKPPKSSRELFRELRELFDSGD
jgi:ribosome-associated protein